jgi:hypothetical protein
VIGSSAQMRMQEQTREHTDVDSRLEAELCGLQLQPGRGEHVSGSNE